MQLHNAYVDLIREACRTEVELMRKLNHPCIVGYRESFLNKNKDTLCIVMSYCDGGDLAAAIENAKGQKFSEAKILHWFVQVYRLVFQTLHNPCRTPIVGAWASLHA